MSCNRKASPKLLRRPVLSLIPRGERCLVTRLMAGTTLWDFAYARLDGAILEGTVEAYPVLQPRFLLPIWVPWHRRVKSRS